MDKKYIITVSRRGKTKDLEPMTVPELVEYFGYTLEKGRSWQNEKGNVKIPTKFTNINKLVKALNDSESNAAANGFADVYYSVRNSVEETKMTNITKAVDSILEGKDITSALLQVMEDSEDDAYYFEVAYDYGNPILVKLDRDTTDYGAILDLVIDHLEDTGVGEPYLIDISQAEKDYNEDEYTIGGNHGLALVHHGLLNIRKIDVDKAEDLINNHAVEVITD